MTKPRTSKEEIYDNEISPLMEKIIGICKEHKINMVADFSLGYDEEADQTLFCTTAFPDIDKEDEKGAERMLRLTNIMKPQFFAFTIISSNTKQP